MDADCLFFPELYRLYDKEIETGEKITSEELRKLVDFCNFCALCPCPPVRADIIEAKTLFIDRDGLKFGVRTLEDVERMATLCGVFPRLTNMLLRGRATGALANLSGAEITVLHVLSGLPPNAELLLATILGYGSTRELKKNKKQIILSIKAYLQEFCNEIINEIPACSVLVNNVAVEAGKPVDTILHHIAQSRCDLVVMGSCGHGLLKEALIGSTSRKVLKNSPKPILIVPPVRKDRNF